MPFDTMKTQMQLNRQMGASLTGCCRSILAKDGFLGLYKGFTPFVTMAAGKAGVRWGSMRVLTDTVDRFGVDRKANNMFWIFTCGIGAGCIEALVWTAPAERLKVLRQKFVGTGASALTYRQIYSSCGVLGLWVGATPTAMRSGSNAAIRFSIAGHVREGYGVLTGTPLGEPLPFFANFLAGGTGGIVSTVCNNPIDVIKTKIQAGYTGGMLACGRDIIAERGFIAFGSGLSARMPQIFLSQAIQFAIMAMLAPLLG